MPPSRGLQTQNVPVPVGGGLGGSVDDWLVRPPKAAEAENMLLRPGGSLQKMPGFDSIGTPGTGERSFLLSRAGKDLVSVGVSDCASYGQNKGWVDAPVGHHVPSRVRMHNAIVPRGAVSDVNIAHNGGYTAIVFQVAEEEYLSSGATTDLWTTRCLVLDEDDNVVWGPHDVPEIRTCPRVVPYTTGGDKRFAFTGCIENWNNSGIDFTLYAFEAGEGNWADPSPAILVLIRPPTGASSKYLYDSYGDASLDRAFVMAYANDSITTLFYASMRGTGLITVASIPGTSYVEGLNYAIFFDDNTDTGVAYSAETESLYAFALTDLTPTVYASAGLYDFPLLYKLHDTGGLCLSGMEIGFTGSGIPATLTFSGSADHVVGGTFRDPQPLPGRSAVFFDQQDRFSTSTLRPLRYLDAVITDGPSGVGTETAYTLVPLAEAWQSQITGNGFHAGDGGVIGTVPQTAVDASGRVLVPLVYDHPGGIAYVEETDRGGPVGNLDEHMHEKLHAGPFNSDVVVGWAEISTLADELDRTEVQHLGSVITASGNVCSWDGRAFGEISFPPAILSNYDDSDTADTYQIRSDYEELSSGSVGLENYDHIEWWSMVAVLVYTDQNGVEYRSRPSNNLTVDSVQGGIDVPCPRISLLLDVPHQRILDNGGSFDVEVYVTERWTGAGETAGASAEADIVETYFLAQRTPLQEDATGYFVPDFLQAEYSGFVTSAGLTTNGGQAIPLYTDGGELPPDRVPASSVMAAAGGYMFLVPSEFPNQLWPSKPLETGRGPEFSASLILDAPADSGGIVSLAAQGDRLVLLCRQGIWELFAGGGGPSADGSGSFPPMRLLHSGDGAVTHRGTVSGPFGVFYCAASGPKILSPDGTVHDIGDDVGGLYDADGIRDAVYHDAENEVWLFQDVTTTSFGESTITVGHHLVFDVDAGGWTSHRLATRAARFHANRLHRFRPSDVDVVRETQPAGGLAIPRYTDAGDSILATYTSPWLSFDDVMGYKRCRRVGILVRAASTGTGSFVVKIRYDYVDTVVDTFTFTSAVLSLAKPVQLRVKPSRQKFDSIQISVEDIEATSGQTTTNTLSWTLVGLELEVASKRGIIKLQQEASQ